MRLTDLNPKWITLVNWSSASPFYVGLSFDCPHCKPRACPTCGHTPELKRLAVRFWPPIDPDNVAATFMVPLAFSGEHARDGDSFETLTISPSIGFDSIGHWHGSLTNGEIDP